MNIVAMSKQKQAIQAIYLFILIVFLLLIPQILPVFWVCICIEILIMGLAGVAVNLLLGYGGAFPFGNSAFYAVGAYTTAILLKKTMVNPVLVLMFAPLLAAATGVIFGVILARLSRFYFAMVSVSGCMVMWTIIRRWSSLTGGDDGMAGVPVPQFLYDVNNVYFFTIIGVGICLLLLWICVNSPFGWTLRAIRENANRCVFININVIKHRFIAIVISSFFMGVAGSLYVVYSHSTFPDYSYWVKSGEFVTLVILGGMSSFLGPLVGAAVLIVLQTFITSVTLYWSLFMGIIICAIVLWMPDGVIGIINKVSNPSYSKKTI